MTDFTLPTWNSVSIKNDKKVLLNPLEQFIYDSEPAGEPAETEFREGLARLIEMVLSR